MLRSRCVYVVVVRGSRWTTLSVDLLEGILGWMGGGWGGADFVRAELVDESCLCACAPVKIERNGSWGLLLGGFDVSLNEPLRCRIRPAGVAATGALRRRGDAAWGAVGGAGGSGCHDARRVAARGGGSAQL